MEDGGDSKRAALSVDNNELSERVRSGSASSGHKRSLSGSLLSKLSLFRMNQATQITPERAHSGIERDGGDILGSSLRGERAMSNALQQQRRTRRRRGSLRKTALLGTRFENRDKKVVKHEHTPRGNFDRANDSENNPRWVMLDSQQQKPLGASTARHQASLSKHTMLGEEMSADDDDVVSFPRLNSNKNNAAASVMRSSSVSSSSGTAGLHLPTPSSSSDSYYALQPDSTYRVVHRTKSSPLATHAVEMKNSPEITWDYSETEWWGWIILIVTWLVFVVGMGSCFGVWSWAWDVGETPYAPPELEDDPTLPIVGYYPALIILTAVMSWVWVMVAWVGMKYFKHANISGEDI
ncbi:hypothetical protein ASPWEDRAFT_504451 [Aspergillus wentii DTO 134E9]|uniref:Uncharacterized protein n=1 Tax=Aspergillus wentii DTO 134E9 TaxID=1073089 RepID=A0A1L9RK65_ASPWE|nr:uncharacterized protein ASPWEDRAFT_504451 [Aspergillus wentii DTO 134E9]OJJ35291.1 hypothetical protein ASPWEDRAFT_504451 [Aspergillus wentii DTO 134E9]